MLVFRDRVAELSLCTAHCNVDRCILMLHSSTSSSKTGRLIWLFRSLLVWLCLPSASVAFFVFMALCVLNFIITFIPLPFRGQSSEIDPLVLWHCCWAVQPVKIVPKMTCYVPCETLSPSHSLTTYILLTYLLTYLLMYLLTCCSNSTTSWPPSSSRWNIVSDCVPTSLAEHTRTHAALCVTGRRRSTRVGLTWRTWPNRRSGSWRATWSRRGLWVASWTAWWTGSNTWTRSCRRRIRSWFPRTYRSLNSCSRRTS